MFGVFFYAVKWQVSISITRHDHHLLLRRKYLALRSIKKILLKIKAQDFFLNIFFF